jgi:hypothetical protein
MFEDNAAHEPLDARCPSSTARRSRPSEDHPRVDALAVAAADQPGELPSLHPLLPHYRGGGGHLAPKARAS